MLTALVSQTVFQVIASQTLAMTQADQGSGREVDDYHNRFGRVGCPSSARTFSPIERNVNGTRHN